MFYQNLKKLRIDKGYTQKQIADGLNISVQAYSRWETGKFSPNLQSLEKLADFFEIPLQKLLSNSSLSIEQILSSETITYKNENLSDDELANLKQLIQEFIEL